MLQGFSSRSGRLPARSLAGLPVTTVSFDSGAKVQVEVAITRSAHMKGLSGRAILSQGEGMLFEMPTVGGHGLWMKDTYVPLDAIFLDAEKKVLGVIALNPLDLTPKGMNFLSKWMLEVPQGWAARSGVKRGSVGAWASVFDA